MCRQIVKLILFFTNNCSISCTSELLDVLKIVNKGETWYPNRFECDS